MTLEEKVGQLLIVHFHGEDVNEDAKNLVQNLHVGGIIYYDWANGLNSPENVQTLSENLQHLANRNRVPIPLLIAVDNEGGVVNRLNKGFTNFPGNKALAVAGDPKLGELSAFAMGQELQAVGVNMNLSPVVDINNNPKNPVIGLRSFGDSADLVISFAKNVLHGFHRSGMITSLKHFPGHGDVEIDSHEDLPILNKTKEQLKEMELRPFAELADQADTIMTAHIIVPSFDSQNCVTLSKDTLSYLRNDIGFEGVIITDSLVMEGLLKNCSSIDDAAIRALNAGCDLLLLGGKQMVSSSENKELTVADVRRIHTSLVNAVRTGLISEERLNEAVQRILDLKERYKLSSKKHNQKIGLETWINKAEHQLLAQKTASLSLQKIETKPLPALDQCKLAFFAPVLTKESIEQTLLLHLGKEASSLFFNQINPSEEEVQASQKMARDADVLVFCSYNAWKNKGQAALITSLLNLDKPVIIIALRDPLDATLFPEANLILTTFSPTASSIQAAYQELQLYTNSHKSNHATFLP